MKQKILLGITGGIAAYKMPLLVRLLRQNGDAVRVVLTAAAQQFVTAATLQTLSGEAVAVDCFDERAENSINHIALARWADTFLVAPASANTIAKMANGLADNLLTTLYLATRARVVIAPAMNTQMWQHPATQENIQRLAARAGHEIIPPADGEQACGEIGAGRLPEPATLLWYLQRPAEQDLRGLTVTITAGGTQEALDPVRFLGNRSSGKMGYALASSAAARGANVHLIAAPTGLPVPPMVTIHPVVSARDMLAVALDLAVQSDIFVAAAAVADYRPRDVATQKLKKNHQPLSQIALVENPDILAAVAKLPAARPFSVGFAAETENLAAYARAKLQQKNLDLIIANDVSTGVFGADDNAVTLFPRAGGEMTLPRQSKIALAGQLWSHIAHLRATGKLLPANGAG